MKIDAYSILAAAILTTATMIPAVAAATPAFEPFTYAASSAIQNPGNDSLACQDTGTPLCPPGHTCKVYSYTTDTARVPGFGKTNMEVCILADETNGTPNVAQGLCAPAGGFAQILFNITKKKMDSVTVGLVGQTCEFFGGSSVSSLVQDLSITAGPMTGKMSINSLNPQGSDALLSVYGTRRNPL